MIVFLVLINGLFAGAEIAVVTSRRAAIAEQADRGSPAARALLEMLDQPERFLATVQVGITVVGAAAAAVGGASLADPLAQAMSRVPFLSSHSEVLALATVVVGISFFSVVIGELVPKSLALRNSEPYALLVARPMRLLSWLSSPLVWLLTSSANLVLKPFGDSTSFTEARHSPRELMRLVEEATRAGTVDKDAGEIASRALEMPELSALDVLIPRQDVLMLPLSASLADVERLLLEHAHNRFPVYEGSRENVVGYINVKDVFALGQRPPIVISNVLRTLLVVTETTRIVELIHKMREARTPIAMVVDEYGGFSGITTLEDLLEEFVGQIWSEHSTEPTSLIEGDLESGAIVPGIAHIREVNRALEIKLPEDGEYTTMAGLAISLAGRIPAVGTELEVGDFHLHVLDATPRRVLKVCIKSRAVASAAASGNQGAPSRDPADS